MQQVVKKHARHAISGFELSKKVLHNLKHFGLTPSAKLVLWVLSDCYNPENSSVVFPSIEFIAEIADIGLTSTKQAIKELVNKGLIIKSKRGKVRGNFNKYLITPKVQNPTSEQSENECFKQPENDLFMRTNKKEQIKKQTTEKNVAAFSTKPKVITLSEVPNIIKNNPKVKDPCAYWASLSDNVKSDYLEGRKNKKTNQEKQAADRYFEKLREENIQKQAEINSIVADNPADCERLRKFMLDFYGKKI
jgi:hypothetical protein